MMAHAGAAGAAGVWRLAHGSSRATNVRLLFRSARHNRLLARRPIRRSIADRSFAAAVGGGAIDMLGMTGKTCPREGSKTTCRTQSRDSDRRRKIPCQPQQIAHVRLPVRRSGALPHRAAVSKTWRHYGECTSIFVTAASSHSMPLPGRSGTYTAPSLTSNGCAIKGCAQSLHSSQWLDSDARKRCAETSG